MRVEFEWDKESGWDTEAVFRAQLRAFVEEYKRAPSAIKGSADVLNWLNCFSRFWYWGEQRNKAGYATEFGVIPIELDADAEKPYFE